MQHIGQCFSFNFLPVASNDNDDLLSFSIPSVDLTFVQSLKYELQLENAATGILLHSKKSRKFFEEVVAAERYIMLRYFSCNPSQEAIRRLKRHILDTYLVPKKRRKRRRTTNK